MKVFKLALIAVLLVTATNAAKIRRGEKRVVPTENTKPSEDATKDEITVADNDKEEKEVHKRGIFHYGGGLAAQSSFWPKTYAAHYGYGWPAASGFSLAASPAAHIHAPTVLKYNPGFHYKSLAAPSLLSGVSSLGAATLPTYASLAPAVSHVHQSATAQPFIIRPGGAVVQSYSVTYPHHKAAVAVKPIHAFASVSPVQPVQPVTPVQPVQPVHHTFQTVQHVQPVQSVTAVHPIQPVGAVHPIQSVAAVQPVHHLHPVQSIHPVQPVQSVVQVQHFKPPVRFGVTQRFPSFFQTSFVQPATVPAIPQRPTTDFTSIGPAFPAIPTFPNPPVFPNIPVVPAAPTPSVPAIPAVPTSPIIPTIPSIPNFPQPQVPVNGFFPINVQPPLPQQPPAFGNINPVGQFPDLGPIVGNKPESGSAEASPQIPVQPSPSPEPELPALEPQPTQQPWKPILYQPPTSQKPVNRPSNTLLPPFDNTPSGGYLPPASSAYTDNIQQEFTIDSNLFDNLSDADIQEIFAQANLAAQRDHHHHTVHDYHTRY